MQDSLISNAPALVLLMIPLNLLQCQLIYIRLFITVIGSTPTHNWLESLYTNKSTGWQRFCMYIFSDLLKIIPLLMFTFGLFQFIFYFDSIRIYGEDMFSATVENAWRMFILLDQSTEYRIPSLKAHFIEATVLFITQCCLYVETKDGRKLFVISSSSQLLPNIASIISLLAGLLSMMSIFGLWSE